MRYINPRFTYLLYLLTYIDCSDDCFCTYIHRHHCWYHCHSLSLAPVKSRLVLPFWYQLTWVVPDKRPLNGCVCVCVSHVDWCSVYIVVVDLKQLVQVTLSHNKIVGECFFMLLCSYHESCYTLFVCPMPPAEVVHFTVCGYYRILMRVRSTSNWQ